MNHAAGCITESPSAVVSSRSPDRIRRLARRSNPKRIHLTDRDLAVLEAIGRYRFLSGDQLRRLVFDCSASRVRRRLRALYDHGLVDRVALSAQPALGLPPFFYVLSTSGAAALRDVDIEIDCRGMPKISSNSVRHDAMVNDFRINLVTSLRDSGWSLSRWLDEKQLKLPTDDGRGRVERIDHPLLTQASPFLPDGYFEIERNDQTSLAFFLEVDRSTHPQRVWKHRAKLYSAYADSRAGLFRQRFGRESFRLVIVCRRDFNGRSRYRNILNVIGKTIGKSDLFLATTVDRIEADGVLGRIWHMPGLERSESLVPNRIARSAIVVDRQSATDGGSCSNPRIIEVSPGPPQAIRIVR